MNQIARNIILILLLLAALTLPAFSAASLIDFAEEDDLTDTDVFGEDFAVIGEFSTAWIRIPVHQMSILLRLGLSIFALFIVYLGGRSKHRRFNDRTIDAGNLRIAAFLKTALFRAVFNFRLFSPCLFDTSFSVTGVFSSYPIFQPVRRIKL